MVFDCLGMIFIRIEILGYALHLDLNTFLLYQSRLSTVLIPGTIFG